MNIQLNTDSHITGSPELTAEVQRTLEATLKQHVGRLTRVEVHLSDVNSSAAGPDDKRCVLEARLSMPGMQPVSANHQAPTIALAVDGAADKLASGLNSALGKRDDVRASAPSTSTEASGDTTD